MSNPTPLYPSWAVAKADFEKYKQYFKAPPYAPLLKGADFGPAIKKLDGAEGYEKRAAALVAVRTAKQKYDALIKQAQAFATPLAVKDPAAQKAKFALQNLNVALQDIWLEADASAQPPRPGGSVEKRELIRSFNLASEFRPKFLNIKATTINVYVEIDKTLAELIKSGEESFQVELLGEIARKELEKTAHLFADTMRSIELKLVANKDPAFRESKIKEANEVLAHYAKIVQDNVNTAVAKEWQAYLQRHQYLKDFKFNCYFSITMGVVSLGVSVASAALSFGALWVNILAAVKAVTDITKAIIDLNKSIDSVRDSVQKDVTFMNDLIKKREKGGGQNLSKAGQATKEMVASMLPITNLWVKSASGVSQRAKQLLGQVSQLEEQRNKLVGKINALIDSMSKLPDKEMSGWPDMQRTAADLDREVQVLFKSAQELQSKVVVNRELGETSLNTSIELSKNDWTTAAHTIVKVVGIAVGVYSLSNFVTQCATHGDTLLKLAKESVELAKQH